MKQKLKQLTKIGILLLGISFFLTNCQEEDSPILEMETVQIEKPKSNIDFDTFLHKFGNQNNARIKTGSKTFSLNNYKFGYSSNIASRENEQSIIQYIDTTTIVAFEFDYIQTYTFEVVPTIESENTFYNIIFYQNEDGSQSKLLKYVCDFDCLNNNIPFSGTIYEILEDETVVNTYNATDSSTNSASRLITDCAFSTRTVSADCTGDEHAFGDPTCLCGTPGHNCTPAFQYTVSDLVCITYNTGGGSNPDDGSSSGGGGTSTGDPNQNDDGTYNLPTDPVKGERATWTSFFNSLSTENQTLLNSNTIVRSQIQNFLLQNYYSNDATIFSNEILNIANLDATIDTNALGFVLEAKNHDKIYNDIDAFFLVSVNQFMALDTSDTSLHDPITIHLLMKMALIRALQPDICNGLSEWQCDIKVFWEASKDVVHIVLDGIGLVPVVGEVADLINGGLYVLEGDGVNATLSFAAAVPIAGTWVTGSKYAIKIIEAGGNVAYTVGTKVRLTWKVLADGTIYFGSDSTCRKQLRKALGMAPYAQDARQAHHIIPLNLQGHPTIQKAASSENAFHLNETLNGIPLDNAVHMGSHNNYDGIISLKLNNFLIDNPNATPNQCYNFVANLIQQIRIAIANNPITPINQLNF